MASSQPPEVPSPGWGYLHTVREHLASPLLLLLENGVLVTVFPPPSAFSSGFVGAAWSRQTTRMLPEEVAG